MVFHISYHFRIGYNTLIIQDSQQYTYLPKVIVQKPVLVSLSNKGWRYAHVHALSNQQSWPFLITHFYFG